MRKDDPQHVRVFLCVIGPTSSMPLSALSKRQSCVSHSTPEAEIVAAGVALRTEGVPGLQLWDRLFNRSVVLRFHEDNQAMIKVCTTGKNAVMRHLGRTHRVAISWLHERFSSEDVDLFYENTEHMAADVFTKGFVDAAKWMQACGLINHVYPNEFWSPAVKGTGGVSSLGTGSAGARKIASCSVITLPGDIGSAEIAGGSLGSSGTTEETSSHVVAPGVAASKSQKAEVSDGTGSDGAAQIQSTAIIQTKREK